MKYLHTIFGLLFSVFYINVLGAYALSFFDILIPIINGIMLKYLFAGYFTLMVIDSLQHNEKRVFPILFLIMVGITLLFPQFMYTPIFFLIIYRYMLGRRHPVTVPLSFVTMGYFISGFIPIAGFAAVTYGWVTYTIKKPVR